MLEKCANHVFDETIKDGDYFQSLEFRVVLEGNTGGFETVIIYKTKDGFFETDPEKV